jgi:hypothetical protein
MKYVHRLSNPWSTLATAAILAVGSSGCASVKTLHKPGTEYTFDVQFVSKCPKAAVIKPAQKNCSDWFSNNDECVKVGAGEIVNFVASGQAPEQWSVFIDPSSPHRARKGIASITIDEDAPLKDYAFSVTAGACTPLDPRIIVEK